MSAALCPVCGYDQGGYPLEWHDICGSCGLHYGYEGTGPDPKETEAMYAQFRDEWIAGGKKWWAPGKPPAGWDPDHQLARLLEANDTSLEATGRALQVIPDHESALRRMVADAHGGRYEAIKSLDEAKATPDAAVVMEGDYGGSIYLTCPAQLVQCDEPTLRQLLHDLDKHDWDDPEGVGLHYEVVPIGSGVAGGTGGGVVTDAVWLHPNLETKGLRERVVAVIRGGRVRLD